MFYHDPAAQLLREVELPSGKLMLTDAQNCMYAPSTLLGYASRQNPKRAYLFVSKVLGKHIATCPVVMASTHTSLAAKLQGFLSSAQQVVVLGFAETATGLGAGVFESMWRRTPRLHGKLLHLQTTRYRFNQPLALEFKEEHSHATGHLLYEPEHPSVFRTAESLVLVDDELTTGKTNLNFLGAFLKVNPNITRVALVCLVNWMTPEHCKAFSATYPHIEFSFVHLAAGQVKYEPFAGFTVPAMPLVEGNNQDKSAHVDCRGSARFGWQQPLTTEVLPKLIKDGLNPSQPVYVVGDGELMHVAYKVARELSTEGIDTMVQATTRSPILIGGAIEEKITYEDHYSDGIANYLYNPPPTGAQVILVHEVPTNELRLVDKLNGCHVMPLHVRDIVTYAETQPTVPPVATFTKVWRHRS